MDLLLVLVSPCFREKCSCHIQNWVFCVVYILYFRKNVVVFFFGNQISKWRSFEKGLFVTYFHIFNYQGKLQKFLQHTYISLTYMYFCSPFLALPILEKKNEFIRYGFSLVWFLVLILIRAILEQSVNNKMVSKI